MDKLKIEQTGGAGFFFWVAGWLFTIGYLHLQFWTGVLAIIIWPYYLGVHIAGM